MLKKFRRTVLKCSGKTALLLELIILAFAIAKVGYLSSNITDTNKAMIEIGKANTFAIEGIRRSLDLKEPNLLEDTKRHLGKSQEIILKYTGKNEIECITARGVRKHVVINQQSPLNELINQEWAMMDSREFMGEPCINEIKKGELSAIESKEMMSTILEYLFIATIGLFLLWIKFEEIQFEKKFPVRRNDHQKIPYYLIDGSKE